MSEFCVGCDATTGTEKGGAAAGIVSRMRIPLSGRSRFFLARRIFFPAAGAAAATDMANSRDTGRAGAQW